VPGDQARPIGRLGWSFEYRPTVRNDRRDGGVHIVHDQRGHSLVAGHRLGRTGQKQEVSYPGQLDVPELKPPGLGRSRQLLVRREGSIDVFDDYARKNGHDD
jgi:hypothetical protein